MSLWQNDICSFRAVNVALAVSFKLISFKHFFLVCLCMYLQWLLRTSIILISFIFSYTFSYMNDVIIEIVVVMIICFVVFYVLEIDTPFRDNKQYKLSNDCERNPVSVCGVFR